jgi:NifU-like protein involved in Fe-S cluster formation
MFSDAVLDHFQHPRNAGKLSNATASVEVSNPVCGDVLHLAARIENGRITEAGFLCQGCATAIACASLLTEVLTGKNISDARAVTAENISSRLGQLPPATMHAAQLAAAALAALLAKIKSA